MVATFDNLSHNIETKFYMLATESTPEFYKVTSEFYYAGGGFRFLLANLINHCYRKTICLQ